jgi:ABC-type dipeptide/oligopeptide/nickel transport system permease subunit
MAASSRTSWELVWSRIRRDRLSLVSGSVLLLIVVACFAGEPLLSWLLGHGPDDLFLYAVDRYTQKPVGPWTWVPDISYGGLPANPPRTLLILGSDSSLGRDQLLRLLAGGQVSIEIAVGAAALAVSVGATLGALAGYFGGLVDAVISRITELVMAFPLLLLVIAIGQTLADRFDFITLHGAFKPGVLSLAAVIGAFTWFYPARIVRAEVLSLRTQEFIDAARVSGASELRIVRTHILPHLAAPLAVWGTLIVGSNMILEAALSFLNMGVRLPTPSWGNMLSANWGTLLAFDQSEIPGIEKTNWTLFWPTAFVFVTVLSLALLGEGLRRAIDPRSAA